MSDQPIVNSTVPPAVRPFGGAIARRPIVNLTNYSMSMYAQCGILYEKRQVQKLAPLAGASPAAIRGRAFHAGAELYSRAKVTDPEAELPVADVQDAAADEFDHSARGENRFQKMDGTTETRMEPTPEWALHGETKEDARNLVLQKIIPAWHATVAKKLRPASVEEWISAKIEPPGADFDIMLRGKIDILPADGVVTDHKHTTQSMGRYRYSTPEDAEKDTQLTIADILYRQRTGLVPVALGWDTVQVAGRGELFVSGVVSPRVPARSDEQLGEFIARATAIAKGIKAGVFIPAKRGEDWWCSRRWCSFWAGCKFGGAAPGAPRDP